MLRFGALIAVAAFAAVPARAEQMNAHEARSFVVGNLFSYQCFEGTRGSGRIMHNGSVAGTIQFRGNGSTRYAMLPQNTIHVVGDRVCATVKGLPFQPCFNLIKTSHNSFRGSVSGMGFAYCDFVRRDRPVIASVERPRTRRVVSGEPVDLQAKPESIPEAKAEAKAQIKSETTGAVPSRIESKELPPVEQKPATAAAGAESEKPELRSTKD